MYHSVFRAIYIYCVCLNIISVTYTAGFFLIITDYYYITEHFSEQAKEIKKKTLYLQK